MLDADQELCVKSFKAAVESKSTLVIRAGAGSGKTHTVSYAIAKYRGALAISHTRVACETLESRATDISEMHDAHIGTIHAIAYKLSGDSAQCENPESGKDFDQMIDKAIALLENKNIALPDWLKTRQYLAVDEFQDTGSLQNTLVERIRSRLSCALIVVGDFAQAIYGFQLASPVHMNNLIKLPDCTVVTLHNNYRSHPAIVEYANRLAHGIPGAIRMRPARSTVRGTRQNPLQLRCYRSDPDMIKSIVRWILHRTKQGILFEGDLLVLYPSKGEAYDYLHRKLDIQVNGTENTVLDGTHVLLVGSALEKGQPLPLGPIRLASSIVDRCDVGNIIVQNTRRKLLVACRRISGGRQILNEVYSTLIAKHDVEPRDIFITDRDNKPANDHDKQRMRNVFISLSTIHGVKGEEFDSQMHVDLGSNRRAVYDEEEHRILYVSHTRAMDELWHVAVTSKDEHYPRCLSRYMTRALVDFYCLDREKWEGEDIPPSDVVLFEASELNSENMCDEILSVTTMADVTKDTWQVVDETSLEVVWQLSPPINKLPEELYQLNATHGQFLEWLFLWKVHESATRHTLHAFLDTVLHRFSVNKDFASAMECIFAYGTQQEQRCIRDEFDRVRESQEQDTYHFFRMATAVLDRVRSQHPMTTILRKDKVKSAFQNIKEQSDGVCPASHGCPVRPTIKHFDSYTGSDTWKLDDLKGLNLKKVLLNSCRVVEERLCRAELSDLFKCLLLMRSINLSDTNKIESDEHGWRILLMVCLEKDVMRRYIEYVESQLGVLLADANLLGNAVPFDQYQHPVNLEIRVYHDARETPAMYQVIGRADATGRNHVLEVTSRDNHFKNKVQQACLYASILEKTNIYNYYVEQRLLVKRTLNEAFDSFLKRSSDQLVLQRGLPGSRHKVDRADFLEHCRVHVDVIQL